MPSEHFHHLSTTEKQFNALLNRYLQAYVNVLGQPTGYNRLHSVYERCARWLLLTHDRVGRAEILLTHEYLAMMLGSRRLRGSMKPATIQSFPTTNTMALKTRNTKWTANARA